MRKNLLCIFYEFFSFTVGKGGVRTVGCLLRLELLLLLLFFFKLNSLLSKILRARHSLEDNSNNINSWCKTWKIYIINEINYRAISNICDYIKQNYQFILHNKLYSSRKGFLMIFFFQSSVNVLSYQIITVWRKKLSSLY